VQSVGLLPRLHAHGMEHELAGLGHEPRLPPLQIEERVPLAHYPGQHLSYLVSLHACHPSALLLPARAITHAPFRQGFAGPCVAILPCFS
jgi:hypothetical protein